MLTRFLKHWRTAGVFAGILFSIETSAAYGQLYSTDPYDPSGRPFRAYAYPGAGEVYGGMSGTPRTRGTAGANRFDSMDDDLGFNRFGRYDSAYRRLDREYGREYIPNESADRKYFADREKRERDMIEARREPDPRKRQQKIKELEEEAKRAASDVRLSVRRGAAVAGANVPPAPTRRPSRAAATPGATAPRGATPGRATDSSIPAAPARRGSSSATPNPSAPARARSGSSDPSIPPAPRPNATGRQRDVGSEKEPRPSDVLDRAKASDRAPRPTSFSPRRASRP